MNDFNITKWFKNQYLIENTISENLIVNIKDLTIDIIKDTFPNKYKNTDFTRKQPSGEIGNFYRDGIVLPNPDDSFREIGDELDLKRWKEEIIKKYGNVKLSLHPDAERYDMVKIVDKKFNKDKSRYIQAKSDYLDSIGKYD